MNLKMTRHFQRRMAQRGNTKQMIDLVFQIGEIKGDKLISNKKIIKKYLLDLDRKILSLSILLTQSFSFSTLQCWLSLFPHYFYSHKWSLPVGISTNPIWYSNTLPSIFRLLRYYPPFPFCWLYSPQHVYRMFVDLRSL